VLAEAKEAEIRDSARSDDVKTSVLGDVRTGTEVDLLISERHIVMRVSSLFFGFFLVQTVKESG
jgi:hypothetical protein